MSDSPKTHVPIALPTVRIEVDARGALAVTVDKEPYPVGPGFQRAQVRQLVEDLTDALGPIRVEITESDGEKYVDIASPREDDPTPPKRESTQSEPPIVTPRFQAGEDVTIAVAVAQRTAETDGNVTVRLPPSFLQRYGDDLVLIGQTSRVSAAFADILQRDLA